MTWQRIDENTYIDDSLVTCAEYQLFIDEMREQGKYYQPDHWTSYQFLARKARDPILGVRHSDAGVFCKWLTEREGKGWIFRLSTPQEANDFPIMLVDLSPFGYWVGENYLFSWNGPIPEDPRGLLSSIDRSIIRNLDRDRNINFSLSLNLASDLTRDRVSDRAIAMNHAISLTCTTVRAIARNLDLDRNIDRNMALDHFLDTALNLALELDLDRLRSRDLDLMSTLGIYIDIFSLRERIAGRSPAFEGIRLVKERIG